MNPVLWLTAGVLAKAGVGEPPAPAPVSVTKGGDARYHHRRRVLEQALARLREQVELEKQLGLVLSRQAQEARTQVVRAILASVTALTADTLDVAETLEQREADERIAHLAEREKEVLDTYDAFMLHCDTETSNYCTHHEERIVTQVRKEEDHNHSTSQEALKKDEEEHNKMLEVLDKETTRAARIRAIQLELAVHRQERELEVAIHNKKQEHLSKLPTKVEPTLAERINGFYRTIR